MKYHLFAALFAVFASFQIHAQTGLQVQVRGTVSDEQGEPVVAASVLVKGTKNLVATAADGSYSIKVKSGDILEYSLLGKKTREIVWKGQSVVDVILADDMAMLEDVVVVGYGARKRQSITGAISKVDGDKIIKAPAQNVTNMLGGVVPGVISYQSTGIPGSDGSALLIRGSGVTAIVDGVARSLDDIDPAEIESISVLKDASAAAIYGLNREAVIIVTTKRGDNKPTRITYKGSFNVSTNAVEMELLDAPGYAYYHNLGRSMDGNDPIFTQSMVDKMIKGEDGWGNTNWYKEVFGVGMNQNHTVSASGGNDKMNFFTTFGYYNQEGNVKGYTHDRMNIRANIETKIAKNLSLTVGLLGRFTKTERPGISANTSEWNYIGLQLMRMHPYVPKTWQGYSTSTRNASSTSTITGYLNDSGYGRSNGNTFNGTGSLRYDVPFIKGLSAKALVAYDIAASFAKSQTKPFDVMLGVLPTTPGGDITYSLTNGYPGVTEISLVQSAGVSTHFLSNYSLEYERSFGKHEVGALALMEMSESNSFVFNANGYKFSIPALDDLNFAENKEKNSVGGSRTVAKTIGYVGRLNYSYDNKYLAEVACRYDGSYVFYGSTSPWGVFPSASAGWRIDRENWFKSPSVDLLKFRVASGLTGSAGGVKEYTYLNTMALLENTAVIGGVPQTSLYTSILGNPDITWQRAWQNNIGVDLTMWNGKLRFEGDIFYKYVFNMISAVSAQYPASWGGRVPQSANKNKQEHKGFEFMIEHRNRVSDFSYGVSLIGTYTYRRWLSYTDAVNTPDYLKLTGKEVGAVLGFIAEGLFQSQEEIDRSATIPGTKARPGDIRYKDRNGDGKITYSQDMGYVGSSVYPKFVGGINLDAAWKGFDMSMKWTMGLGRSVAMTGQYMQSSGIMDHTAYTRPFYHNGNSPRYLAEGSWTENNRDARFPRLSVDPTNNNAFSSTWWYENGNYLRLKNLQIGYSLPGKWMKAVGMRGCRIFFEGTNLFTFSKLTQYNIDPEMPSVNNGYYPQQRLLGGGLDIQF